MKEYLLKTNQYNEPASESGSDAYATLLMRLLLLEPGTNPLHPAMGVGLGPKYRFISETDMNTLQTLIQDQVNTYLPSNFMNTTKAYVELNKNKFLRITVIADDTKFVLDTEESSTPVELSSML